MGLLFEQLAAAKSSSLQSTSFLIKTSSYIKGHKM